MELNNHDFLMIYRYRWDEYSDDDRIEKMFDALHRQSRDQQIIVFSCHQHAFAKLGGR